MVVLEEPISEQSALNLKTVENALSETAAELEAARTDAAFLPFETHKAATDALMQVGFCAANSAPDFGSEQLADAVNALLKDESVVMMDMTSAIPSTSQAAYQALTVAAFDASVASRKDRNAAFLIMRTAENTPSFLFGVHHGLAQTLGNEADVQARLRKSETPAAFVIFRERQITIPSSICLVDEELASRMVAAEVAQKDDFFRCEICLGSFVTRTEGGTVAISEVAITECKHTFHRACAAAHIAKTGSGYCPKCNCDATGQGA